MILYIIGAVMIVILLCWKKISAAIKCYWFKRKMRPLQKKVDDLCKQWGITNIPDVSKLGREQIELWKLKLKAHSFLKNLPTPAKKKNASVSR